MSGSRDDLERRLTELKKEVTKRGFDRFASRLKNVSELPIELRSAAVTALASREAIQTILMFPQQIQRGWQYVPKQALLFTATGMIHILASIWPGEEPRVTCLKGCNLLYLKVTLILLYGFLEIVAQGESELVRVGVEFNTVDWQRLSAPLQCFLEMTKSTVATPMQTTGISPAIQRAREQLPLKFSNGIRIYGLLPDEKLEEFVFQGAAWERRFLFFQRPISANMLLLLTSHYMVVIEEELNVKQGWIVSYLPRGSITGIRCQACDLSNELSVQLRQGDQSVDYKLMLNNEVAEAWHKQWVQHGEVWKDIEEQQA